MRSIYAAFLIGAIALTAEFHTSSVALAQDVMVAKGTPVSLDRRFGPWKRSVIVRSEPSVFSEKVVTIDLCHPTSNYSCTELLLTSKISNGWVEVYPNVTELPAKFWAGWILADFVEIKYGKTLAGKNLTDLLLGNFVSHEPK